MINLRRSDILVLIEPRVSGSQVDEICMKVVFENWIRVETVGFSDGIWIFWKEKVFVDIICTNPQFILLQVSDGKDPLWLLSVVYGSLYSMLRDRLWEEHCSSLLDFDGPWLSIGDYSTVVSGGRSVLEAT